MQDHSPDDYKALKLKLSGYVKPGQELFRNVLFDRLYSSMPTDREVKVQIYNAEIAAGGFTNWHCHNGATFFVALEGVFEAQFEAGLLIQATAGDVYSEPIGAFHRGHNPHASLTYALHRLHHGRDRDHGVGVPPWWKGG